MTYRVFIADTIAGRFQIAVKTPKTYTDADARSDAYSVAHSLFGRGATVSRDSKTLRRLTDAFDAVACAPDWAAIARA